MDAAALCKKLHSLYFILFSTLSPNSYLHLGRETMRLSVLKTSVRGIRRRKKKKKRREILKKIIQETLDMFAFTGRQLFEYVLQEGFLVPFSEVV